MTESINVFLTSAQKNKLSNGKTFQLSAHQLQAGHGKFHVEIQLTLKNHKQLLKNVSQNKGFRFRPDMIQGSGIFGNIAKGIAKAVAPTLLDKIGDYTGQKGITNALKNSTDGVIDAVSDKITGGRLKKGSVEMKAHMAKLRAMRKVKGGDIFGDLGRKIKDGFNKTFTPDLGNKIKDVLGSPVAKQIYKGVANAGIGAVSAYTGQPMLGAVGSDLVNSAIDGSGVKKRRYKKKNLMVVGGTLTHGVAYPQLNNLRRGGSFASPL